jgi:hypothetical protein
MTAFENAFVHIEVSPQTQLLVETWKAPANRIKETEWMKLRFKSLELIRRHQVRNMLSLNNTSLLPSPSQEQWFAQQVQLYAPSLQRYAYTGQSKPELSRIETRAFASPQEALHWLST